MPTKTKIKRLGDLGELRTGFQLRGMPMQTEPGETQLVQMSDVQKGQPLLLGDVMEDPFAEETLYFNFDARVKERDLLQPGDILLRGRGGDNGASWVEADPDYEGEPQPKAVAAAPLYVLRLSAPDKVYAPYLCWFINRPDVQSYLYSTAQGTGAPYVSIRAFADLPVTVPPLSLQKKIIEVRRLQEEEARLLYGLRYRQEQLLYALHDLHAPLSDEIKRFDLEDPFAP